MPLPELNSHGSALPDAGSRTIIAIAGSLRRDSLNRRLLEAAPALAPPSLSIRIHDLGDIPLFNEDLEVGEGPQGVARLREAVAGSAGLLIATPEYNQSLPGVTKNVIDWLSRGDPCVLSDLPVGLLGATSGPWGTRIAQSVLRHTLAACGALTMPTPQFYLAGAAGLFVDGAPSDPQLRGRIESFLAAFARWTEAVGGRQV